MVMMTHRAREFQAAQEVSGLSALEMEALTSHPLLAKVVQVGAATFLQPLLELTVEVDALATQTSVRALVAEKTV